MLATWRDIELYQLLLKGIPMLELDFPRKYHYQTQTMIANVERWISEMHM